MLVAKCSLCFGDLVFSTFPTDKLCFSGEVTIILCLYFLSTNPSLSLPFSFLEFMTMTKLHKIANSLRKRQSGITIE